MRDYLRSSIKTDKPIVYIDMDGVLCDFDKRAKELEENEGIKGHRLFKHPSAYKDLEPIDGAIDAWHALQEKYETYILSTPPWSNPDAWSEKRKWVEQFFGKSANKKLILCHNKGLVKGTPVALKGRVPVKITGPVTKKDRLVANNNGTASAVSGSPQDAMNVFAIALETNVDAGVKFIECVIL
jgi:hypothetical protein